MSTLPVRRSVLSAVFCGWAFCFLVVSGDAKYWVGKLLIKFGCTFLISWSYWSLLCVDWPVNVFAVSDDGGQGPGLPSASHKNGLWRTKTEKIVIEESILRTEAG